MHLINDDNDDDDGITMLEARRGRVGSGQGNPRISSVAVLSRADRAESTQNHFESF